MEKVDAGGTAARFYISSISNASAVSGTVSRRVGEPGGGARELRPKNNVKNT